MRNRRKQILVSIALLLSAGSWAPVVAQDAGPSPKTKWVTRVVYDERRNPVAVEHKWPFGSPDNIGLIRVPWGYRDLLFGPSPGAQLTNNMHQPSLEQGYGSMFFWALLPGVTPHDQRVPPVVGMANEFDLLRTFVVAPGPTAEPFWSHERTTRNIAKLLYDGLNRGLDYRDIPKVKLEGRFGLSRIGPERVVINPNYDKEPIRPGPPPHDDLWFDGRTLETSENIIKCGADYRGNGERDPEDMPRTLCEHHFAHDGLNARVKLGYTKKHLKDWREIQAKVRARLNEFKTTEKPKD